MTMSISEPAPWTIGALASAAGVTVRTLHHYDRLGLLVASERTSGGHRRYTENDVAHLYQILALRSLGFELAAIRPLVGTTRPAPLIATAKLQRERVEQQLDHYERLRHRLDEVINSLEHNPSPPIPELFNALETMTMNVHLTRIYTRLGDDGQTHLADLSRVPKTDPRIEAIGAIDELGATIGFALATPSDLPGDYRDRLLQVQNDLFDLGADLARPAPAADQKPHLRIDESYVLWLERLCDEVNADLTELNSFVLPGGTLPAAHMHLCRTACRRAERRVLAVPDTNTQIARYLNRLSDLLFILGRAANDGGEELLWRPGRQPA